MLFPLSSLLVCMGDAYRRFGEREVGRFFFIEVHDVRGSDYPRGAKWVEHMYSTTRVCSNGSLQATSKCGRPYSAAGSCLP